MMRVASEATAQERDSRLATTIVACVSVAMVVLDLTVVSVALDEISTDVDAPLSGVQWVVNGYSLATAALLLSAGSLADRLGRRGVFLVGMAVFTAASAACAVAPTVTWLTAARIVQGLGGALVMGTTVGLIAGVYEGDDPRRRQAAIGAYTSIAATAAAFGPVVGGALVEAGGWRSVFVVNIPIGVALIAGTLAYVGAQRHRDGSRLDLAGAALAALGLFALNYAVLTGTEGGWGRPAVVATLVTSLVLLAAFLARQRRLGPDALLDLRLFRIPTFTGAVTLSFTARLTSLGLFPFITLWLSGVVGHTPLQVGLTMMAISLPQAVVSSFSGRAARRASARVLCASGTAVTGAGLLWAAAAVGAGGTWAAMLPGMVVMGVGSGIVMPQLVGLAIAVVPADQAGMASGATSTFFPLGSSAGVATYGAFMTAVVGARSDDPAAVGRIVAGRLDALDAGTPAATAEVVRRAGDAFASGLSVVLVIAGVVAFASCVAALRLLPAGDAASSPPAG